MTVKEKIEQSDKFYESTELDYSDCSIDEILTVSPKAVYPRYSNCNLKDNLTEWDLIDEDYVASDEMIEVSVNKYGELVIHDGHNRLYRDINKSFIKVKIVDRINSYYM